MDKLLADTSATSGLAHEQVLHILEDNTHAGAQAALGASLNSAPEVLYYLATEGDVHTRCAVAANPSTPPQANQILASDIDGEVRAELARKIARLMPTLSQSENQRLCEMTIQTLEQLARDQLPHVRAILSEEVKHLDCIPKSVVELLVRDAQAEVVAPVAEYSPLLSDADLKEVVACAQISAVICAVARRRPLTQDVADAIVTSLDVPAVATLLVNPKASIRKKTLEAIARQARDVNEWHEPLVMRVDLSQRVIRRIAGFVGASLLALLAKRHGLEEGTRRTLSRALRQRVEQEKHESDSAESALREAEAALKAGHLDDAFVEFAVDTNRRESVIAGLALLANIPVMLARRMVNSHKAKVVTALAWRAGLSMRVAFKIQSGLLRLPAGELLPARAGVDYPLSEDEMRWHLDYFGVAI